MRAFALCVVIVGLVFASPAFVGAQAVTLAYWHHIHKPANDLEARLAREFEQRNPGVHIEITLIEDADLNTKLLTAMAGGSGPDVFNLFDGNFKQYATAGLLAPVDLQTFQVSSYDALAGRWLRGSFAGYTYQGKIYGIPSELSSYGFWINTKHFQESGLDPQKDAPRTWEDVARVGQTLARYQGNTLIRKGYAQSWRFTGRYLIIFDAMIRQAGGQIFDSEGTHALLQAEPARKALQTWVDFVRKYRIDDPALGGGKRAEEEFGAGLASMMGSAGSWFLPLLKEQYPDVSPNTRVIPYPRFAGGPDIASDVYGYAWMVNAKSANPKVAERFVEFMSSHQRDYIGIGIFQPRLGWFDTPEARNYPYFNLWVSELSKGNYTPRVTRWEEASAVIGRMIERAAIEGADVTQSVNQARQELDRALK
jgi:multiple sugar transport system substrate-binding protein